MSYDDENDDYGDEDIDGEWGDYGNGGNEYGNEYEDDVFKSDSENDYGSDGDWENDIGQNQDLQHNYNVREQVGNDNTGCWDTDKDGKALQIQSPLGKFCLKVDAVSRNIMSECKFMKNSSKNIIIGQEDINTLLNASQSVPRVRYKNPTAFVLGYLTVKMGTNKIDKNTLLNVYECYKKTSSVHKDESVKEADVIRYARLWNTINNK